MSEDEPNFKDLDDARTVNGAYDYLFAPVQEPVIDEEEKAKWPVLKDYEKKWFAPIESAEPLPKEPKNYDYLFDETRPGPEPYDFTKHATNSGDGGRRPTPETEKDTIGNLVGLLDSNIMVIIKNFVPLDGSPQDIMKAVRQNSALREDLARYFLYKIQENTLRVPYRVAVDTEKSPNHTGYPDIMYSRAYAALLAISMLDGTYNKSLSEAKRTRPEYDKERGGYVTGQHQAAAEFLLFDLDKPIQP